MVEWVRQEAGDKPFTVRVEYEPYYLQSEALRSVQTSAEEQHVPKGSGGYLKNETQAVSVNSLSNTASPRLAD
ncbi:MAG: hypothetical protein KatS3mg104_3232 [Phycisphaerae bacterium]|nr:MAG: hypothetical protein KatS3mg104_3232 [Phycisphaerae bacterium]